MNTSRAVVGALLVGLASALVPTVGEAQGACGCTCPAESGEGWGRYGGGAILTVPPNASFLVDVRGAAPATLQLEGGAVPLTVEPVAGVDGWVRITPLQTLEERFDYYRLTVEEEPSGEELNLLLTVEGDPDTTPPDAEIYTVGPSTNEWLCQDLVGAEIRSNVLEDERAVLEVEVIDGTTSLGRVMLRSDRSFGAPSGIETQSGCFESHVIEGLVAGNAYTARITAWDAAGNSSVVERAFTAERAAALPSGTACPYCAFRPGRTPAPGLAGMSLACFALVLVARRRRG